MHRACISYNRSINFVVPPVSAEAVDAEEGDLVAALDQVRRRAQHECQQRRPLSKAATKVVTATDLPQPMGPVSRTRLGSRRIAFILAPCYRAIVLKN